MFQFVELLEKLFRRFRFLIFVEISSKGNFRTCLDVLFIFFVESLCVGNVRVDFAFAIVFYVLG